MSAIELIEQAKRAAAYEAVDKHFPDGATAVGIGSGSTVIYAVQRIADRKDVDQVVFVPTGFQSSQLITEAGLRLGNIEQYKEGDLDVTFDGADEVDVHVNCIKGGGACLFQEKLVAQCSKALILMADSRKSSKQLGTYFVQGVPVEVVPSAFRKVTSDLHRLGAKTVKLRQGGKAKAGPIVTDNGNFILDAHFGQINPTQVHALDQSVKLLVGVVETGLFTNANTVYFGEPDGSASSLTRPNSNGDRTC